MLPAALFLLPLLPLCSPIHSNIALFPPCHLPSRILGFSGPLSRIRTPESLSTTFPRRFTTSHFLTCFTTHSASSVCLASPRASRLEPLESLSVLITVVTSFATVFQRSTSSNLVSTLRAGDCHKQATVADRFCCIQSKFTHINIHTPNSKIKCSQNNSVSKLSFKEHNYNHMFKCLATLTC